MLRKATSTLEIDLPLALRRRALLEIYSLSRHIVWHAKWNKSDFLIVLKLDWRPYIDKQIFYLNKVLIFFFNFFYLKRKIFVNEKIYEANNVTYLFVKSYLRTPNFIFNLFDKCNKYDKFCVPTKHAFIFWGGGGEGNISILFVDILVF